ncbi:gliding motility-associated C-terminal domain-containing protein [Yeosuana marina]|uniref:gliding motility-associated C-terminal domain-containing protein n=1 Tax=Yeosuana marina TaxID=1565536 RepID=UPI0030EC52BE
MKTKLFFRHVLKYTTYIFVFMWTLISANAQCPTIADPTPPAICDAAGYTFADLSADYATDTGGGIVWYSAATGGTIFYPNQLVSEGTYYAGDSSGSCSSRSQIDIAFSVGNSGIINRDRFYCSNENAIFQDYIDLILQPGIPSGGSVKVYYDSGLTNEANGVDLIPLGVADYYIVFDDAGGCRSQIEKGRVGVFLSPIDPTPASPQEFCIDNSPTIADLDPGTVSTVNWYAGVDVNGDPILPALPTSTPLVDGNTYYVQIDEILCDSNAVPVTVTINTPNNPGASGSLDYCQNNVPTGVFDLFDSLSGADATGTWSGPRPTSNGFQGTVDISTLTTPGIYTFTYTVPANGACPESSSSVTITIYETFSSGVASSANPATFCESGLPSSFDLFSLLDSEDAGGQWTEGTLSTGTVITSSIDLTSLTASGSPYNFTYTQNVSPSICAEESTTVQVIVLPDPNAGTANNQTFCENDLIANSPFNLFDALTAPYDSGGIWTDASSTTVSDPLNLDITGFTVTGSPYNFTYTVDNGTCTDDETISITILPAPESGTANTPVEFCEASAPSSYNLFDLLTGADSTGTWYIGTDNLGATTSNLVDLSGYLSGTYNFTYDVDAIGSCDDVLVTVQVIINPLPNTGIANNPPPFCENDSALTNTSFDLFTLLTGAVDSGGTWSDDSTTPISGALSGNTLDLSQLVVNTYNFSYSITDSNGCSNSTTVTIQIDPAPESGTANTPVEFCEASAPSSYNLFDLLTGADSTGTWYIGTDNLGATTSNLVDLSGYLSGTYNFTYDVDAIGSCDDVLVTVQVIINPLPNTGIANNPPPFCENDSALTNTSFDLFTLLTGAVDSGGTWSDDSTTPISGALSGNTLDLSQLVVNTYNFSYSITDSNGCSNSTTVAIVIDNAPESGTPVATFPEFCKAEVTTGQTVNLFDLLDGEDQTGTWADDDSSGALSGNTVTIDGLSAGTYSFTYDVAAIGSCDDVNVTVSIIINDTLAPTASPTQEFCDAATVSELAVTTGTAVQWYDVPSGGTALSGTTALADGQVYYATQTIGCESSARTAVTATIYQSPNAGNANTTPIVACSGNNSIDLNSGLDGTQDPGGVWQDTDGTGALTGNIFDATVNGAGTYQFTYYVSASSPCVDDSTIITVTIEEPLSAGTDNTLDVCSNNGTTDLFTLIGSADTGGTWSPAMASGTGVFDPLVDAQGTYTYSLTNACGTFSSKVDVTVTQAPNAGTDNAVLICVIDGPTDLFTFLGTDAQTGGTWSPALPSGTGVFDPLTDANGTYTYTVSAISPCATDSSAQITVTVDDSSAPTVVTANPEFCLENNPTVADLDASLSATGTIKWYTDATLLTPLDPTDTLIDGEDYFATQTNSSGCESSQNVQVNVTVNDAPTPTLIDPNLELCINDNPTIMELTLNISEYNSTTDNVIWYDVATGGSPLSSSSLLSYGVTYYAALYDASTGCESSVRLAVTPDVTSCGKIALPDGFSPNGDGVNDTYDYNNLDILYPNFEIEIFNRYGNIVYKGRASNPRFDGTSNQARTLVKGDLPVGVYFYIFKFNDGENKPEQGRLYLSR